MEILIYGFDRASQMSWINAPLCLITRLTSWTNASDEKYSGQNTTCRTSVEAITKPTTSTRKGNSMHHDGHLRCFWGTTRRTRMANEDVVYQAQCRHCGWHYTGETGQEWQKRFYKHWYGHVTGNDEESALADHFLRQQPDEPMTRKLVDTVKERGYVDRNPRTPWWFSVQNAESIGESKAQKRLEICIWCDWRYPCVLGVRDYMYLGSKITFAFA